MRVCKASVRSLLPVGGKSGGTVPAPFEAAFLRARAGARGPSFLLAPAALGGSPSSDWSH